MKNTSQNWIILFTLVVCCAGLQPRRPTLYLIGDSTVRNGSGTGGGGLWGWGKFLPEQFDTTRLRIDNQAIGGRSSRTFLTEGRWEKVRSALQAGDFVMMQFGHNDGGPLNTGRARASLKGAGDESQEVVMEATNQKEVVRTYGWYLRKYIAEAKAKGALPIVLSPVPRNVWKNGQVVRASEDYGKWAAEVARQEGVVFIDLNEIVAKKYDAVGGEEKLKQLYFVEDHTHTNEAGARLNAAAVADGLKQVKNCPLNGYLLINTRR